ncbi:hypothetical protein ABIA39_008408 [Nocardia sp. GAS34]|uniref:hypothetical protein n=1 Tax=unclassified Nocardia TaxID=2637762 RepID=UPI003D1F7E79
MHTSREELLDSVTVIPESRIPAATELPPQLEGLTVRREFHSAGLFSGEPDLAVRAKWIVLEELAQD